MAKHHSLGGSNTYTWLNCAGSRKAILAAIKAGKILKEEPTNIHMEKGTVAHALGEICLDNDYDPSIFYNKTISEVIGKRQTKKYLDQKELHHIDLNKEVMDSEYIEAVQLYVDYVRDSLKHYKNKTELFLERSYSLEDYVDDDCGGSADATIIEENGYLHVIDYKHGKGVVVSATDNPQLKLYGLGAALELKDKHNFQLIKLDIVQPRASHADGIIRTQEISVNALLKWGEETVKPAVKLLNSDNPELTPGEKQCMWCRVRGICGANAKYNLELAQKDFDEIALPNDKLIEPKFLTIEEATLIIDNKPRIEKWLKAVQAYLEAAVEAGGVELESHKLVERISNRQYKNENSILRRLNRIHSGIDPYEKKIKSPAQMELLLKTEYGYSAKEAKALVDKFTHRIKIGVALAPVSDGRAAIDPPIKTEFKNEISGGEETDIKNFYK